MKLIRFSIFALSAALLFTSCKKQCDCDVTPAIIVNAGNSQYVQLPVDSATLTGTVTSGQSSTLVYSWTLISGPNTPTITNSSSETAKVKTLIAGTYVFQFQAENNEGTLIGLDTTSVVVGTAPIQKLTVQPSNNQYEGLIQSLSPGGFEVSDANQVLMSAWTVNGVFQGIRECIKFDFSSVPAGATIDTATLFLYSNPTPINGDKVHAQSGSTNSCYIQRITSNWVLPTTFSWNNPPAATTTDEAFIPQSTSSNEDAVVDVTALVQDMEVSGNNGFYIGLQNEQIYNVRQYANSLNSDPTIRPKLVIVYH